MDSKTKDCVFSVVLLLFGSFVLYEAVGMVERATKPPFNITTLTITPGFLPLLLGGALILLSFILLVSTLAKEASPLAAFTGHMRTCASSVSCALKDRAVLRVIACVLIMAVYTFFVLGQVPFAVGAGVFLVALMSFLQAANFRTILITSVVAVALIIGLFEYLFKTTLP